MARITTSEELLKHLAARGDPSAFHTLVANHALSSYVIVRNSGKNHEEAVDVIIPFLAKLHSAFLGNQAGLSFAEWYDARRKRFLPNDLQSRDEEGAEAFLEAIPPEDIARFDECIRVAFQRNSSAHARPKGGFFLGRMLATSVTSNRILRTAIVVAVVIMAACAALCATLACMHASLSLAFSKDSHLFTVELPGAIPGFHRFGQQADSRPSQLRGDIVEDSTAIKSAGPGPVRDSVGSKAPEKQTVARPAKGIPAVAPAVRKRQAWHSAPQIQPDSSSISSSLSGAHPAYKGSLESEKDTTSHSFSDKHQSRQMDTSAAPQ